MMRYSSRLSLPASVRRALASSVSASPNAPHIRLSTTNANPYAVLGLKQGAPRDEIKKAYRVLARKHHPDAPGGSHEKFQEIQAAYEAVKSGVWVPRGAAGGDGAAGGGDGGNRYSNFRYTTRQHRSKVSYDEFYAEMHTGRVRRNPFGDEDADEGAARDPRRNPLAGNEALVQAWFRFIILWSIVFVALRVTLFVMFPPKYETPRKKPMPERPRKPPPPKPLMNNSLVA